MRRRPKSRPPLSRICDERTACISFRVPLQRVFQRTQRRRTWRVARKYIRNAPVIREAQTPPRATGSAGSALSWDCFRPSRDCLLRPSFSGTLNAACREEDVVKRTISIHENLLALAANVLKLRDESLEIAGGKREQKPIAGPS
jgi:hypothetical protein